MIVAGDPGGVLPVEATELTLYIGGGIKRSEFVTTFPFGVLSEMCPDPVDDGAVTVMEVELAAVGFEVRVTFTVIRSFEGVGSKFAPAIVTAVPAATI